jgi:hypothetical protein
MMVFMSNPEFDPKSLIGKNSLDYLVKPEAKKRDSISQSNSDKLEKHEADNLDENGTNLLLYRLALALMEGASISRLAFELQLDRKFVQKLLDTVGIPYADRLTAVRNFTAQEDEEKKAARMARLQEAKRAFWDDQKRSQAAREAAQQQMLALRANPEIMQKNEQQRKEGYDTWWSNADTRKRHAERVAQRNKDRWQNDLEYRAVHEARLAEIRERLRHNPEHRLKMSAVNRRTWDYSHDRLLLTRPTRAIAGIRGDLGFHAKSMLEANIARVFRLQGYVFHTNTALHVQVTDEFAHLFTQPTTQFNVDFITTQNGRTCIYEIMIHPEKDDRREAKLAMAKQQYPEVTFIVIDRTRYDEYQRDFEEVVNESPEFAGWERRGFNLRTHPQIFGPQTEETE